MFGYIGKSNDEGVTQEFIEALAKRVRCANGCNLFVSYLNNMMVGQCRLLQVASPFQKDGELLVHPGVGLDPYEFWDFPDTFPQFVCRVIRYKLWGAARTKDALWLVDAQPNRIQYPFCVIDLRKALGQIFFCSTAEIWRVAVEACPSVKQYIPVDQIVIEFPKQQVWYFKNAEGCESEDGIKDWNIHKYSISEKK